MSISYVYTFCWQLSAWSWEKPRDGRQQLSLVKRLSQIGIRALVHAPQVIGLLVLYGEKNDFDIVCLIRFPSGSYT